MSGKSATIGLQPNQTYRATRDELTNILEQLDADFGKTYRGEQLLIGWTPTGFLVTMQEPVAIQNGVNVPAVPERGKRAATG
jgi:hypothetical protein